MNVGKTCSPRNRLARPPAAAALALLVVSAALFLAAGPVAVWAMQPDAGGVVRTGISPLGPAPDAFELPPPSLREAVAKGTALLAKVAAAHPNQDQTDPFATIDACVADEMAGTVLGPATDAMLDRLFVKAGWGA